MGKRVKIIHCKCGALLLPWKDNSKHICRKTPSEIEQEKVDALPQSKRQEILDLFKAGGISIGKLGEKLNIDSMVVGRVIYNNIETKKCSYLRIEAK